MKSYTNFPVGQNRNEPANRVIHPSGWVLHGGKDIRTVNH